MAVGANKLFLSHYGIAITGHATLMPESDVNELFAFFAIAWKNEILLIKKIFSTKKDSVEVQQDFVGQVMLECREPLKAKR